MILPTMREIKQILDQFQDYHIIMKQIEGLLNKTDILQTNLFKGTSTKKQSPFKMCKFVLITTVISRKLKRIDHFWKITKLILHRPSLC